MTMMDDLHQFALPNTFPPETQEATTTQVISNFQEKLPVFNDRRQEERFRCPYCNIKKGSGAMQMDHVIPKRIYMRYKAMQNIGKLSRFLPRAEHEITSFINAQVNEPDNLVLACAPCNRKKSNKLLSPAEFDAYAVNLPPGHAVRLKMEQASAISRHIEDIGFDDLDLYTFIIVKHWWNARFPAPVTFRTRLLGVQAGQMETENETDVTDEQQKALSSIVATCTASVVPQTSPHVWDLIAPGQSEQDWVNVTGRLCLYCLGLHDDAAFQIDHIRPQSRGIDNRPSNLVPVCQSCNASKGDGYKLYENFFLARTRARIENGIFGIENVITTHPVRTVMFAAWKEQLRIFEDHVEAKGPGAPGSWETYAGLLGLDGPAPDLDN
ncbi:HNH endonuclease [Burkholderia gladioli]|uniref:HNH endonuclease n=1 Tax=Burkholderia gladioli TaxID=28095 RepID=UPI001ABA3431|nr:HNH endonuclease [Burkholderia gladioli]